MKIGLVRSYNASMRLSHLYRCVLLSFLFVSFSSNIQLWGQVNACGMMKVVDDYRKDNPEEYRRRLSDYNSFIKKNVQKSKELKENNHTVTCPDGLIIIPIAFHLFHDGDSIGKGFNYSLMDLQKVVDQLNMDFSGYERLKSHITRDFLAFEAGHTCIQFTIGKINRIEKTSCPAWRQGATHTELNLCLPGGSGRNSANDPDNYLNVYVTDLESNFLGVASSIPPLFGKTNAKDDGVSINREVLIPGQQMNSLYNRGSVLAHEIGHWLGLPHVNGDINGTGCQADDGFTDTYAQSDLRFYFCNDAAIPESCGSIDNIFNFMDYSADCAKLMFTEEQAFTMREVLKKERYQLTRSFARGMDDRSLYSSACRLFESNSSLFDFVITDCYGEINLLEYQSRWYPSAYNKSNGSASLTTFFWQEELKGKVINIEKKELARKSVVHEGKNYMDVHNYVLYMKCWDPYREVYSDPFPAGRVMALVKRCKRPNNDLIENAIPLYYSSFCKEQLFTLNNAAYTEGEMINSAEREREMPDVWFKLKVEEEKAITIKAGLTEANTPGIELMAYIKTEDTWQNIGIDTENQIDLTNPKVGSEIFIRVVSIDKGGAGSFYLCVTAQALQNDICSRATELLVSEGCHPIVFHNIGAKASSGFSGQPICGRTSNSADVWFAATVPESGYLNIETFYVDHGLEEIIMEVYAGSCENPHIIACSSIKEHSAIYDKQALVQISDRLSGEQLWIRVMSSGKKLEGEFQLCAYDGSGNLNCRIQLIEPLEQSECEGVNSTYAQKLRVYYNDKADGELLYINNQSFSLEGSPQDIWLEDLPADSRPVSITANLINSADQSCWQQSLYKAHELFAAPEACFDGELANDECIKAIELTPTATCEQHIFSNIGATYSIGSSAYFHCGVSGYKPDDVWFKTIVPESGHIKISTPLLYNENNMILEVYEGPCDQMLLLGCDQFGGKKGSEVEITQGIPGEVLYIRVADQGSNTQGDFAICVTTTNLTGFTGAYKKPESDNSAQIEIRNNPPVAMRLYPNPASSIFTVDGLEDGEYLREISVFNSQSQPLFKKTYKNKETRDKIILDQMWTNGAYLVATVTDKRTVVQPMIILK